MKKTAYIQLFDHQDPLWNKAFEDHILESDGTVIRPYSEREEMQFDRWFDILPGTGAICMIETTCPIRKYLERNPHRLDQLRRLCDAGQVDFLAGGATVIDYNMVHGESIYRNFLYSFRWLEKTFGIRPTVAGTNDTFGISAQMPQIFSQFGQRWLPLYSRMFGHEVEGIETEWVYGKPVRPFWRGLDGSLICVQRDFRQHGRPSERLFVNYQYKPCPACRGEGCRFCEYTGLDRHIEFETDALRPAFEQLLAEEASAGLYLVHSEETVRSERFLTDLQALADACGVDLHYTCPTRILETWARPVVDMIGQGRVTDAMIDERVEGNPIATGCYITRSVLKRRNRELEHLLLAAETFCALAGERRYVYPAEVFERLWTLMSLTQAHDALTGNHPDGPFLEMLEYYRKIRLGAGRHMLGACRAIAADIDVVAPDGVATVAVFNPLNWTVDDAPSEIMIPAAELPGVNPAAVTGWTVRSADGVEQLLTRWETVTITDKVFFRLHCRCDGLPAMGYATLSCEPVLAEAAGEVEAISDGATSADAEAAGLQARAAAGIVGGDETAGLARVEGDCIENEFYRIEFDPRGIRAIVDKQLGRTVAGPGALDLWAEDDCGSLWERLKSFGIRKNLSDLAEMRCRAWTGKFARLEITGRLASPLVWDIPENWTHDIFMSRGRKIRTIDASEVEVLIRHCRWRHELTLRPGSRQVDIRTTLECDSENIRLLTCMDLGLVTPDDRAWYEIPYGMLERPSYTPIDGTHLCPDGVWPAVHWAAAVDPDGSVTCGLLNRGIVAHRFVDGVMELHLLRSGRLNVWGSRDIEAGRAANPLGKDIGEQVFDYALVSGPGDVAANRLVHRGCEFNSVFPAVTVAGDPGDRGLPPAKSFLANSADNVVIAAVKRAEDGDGLVARMVEAYGQTADDALIGAKATGLLSPMEEALDSEEAPLAFRPFEIKTVGFALDG